ncbi:MAG: hypothetical protein KDK99_04470 [Verrucomicrobiales bacterium]|nr:hypothetical protein [Verrucomicrobiales bacterium]
MISRLEARWGRFAIPGLVQILAWMQFLTLILIYVSSPEAQITFIRFLQLDPDKLMHGEVWRIFSHLFIPRTFSPLLALIGTLFLVFIGRGLDEAWGPFRVNLYVLGGALCLTAGALLTGFQGGGLWLLESLLFAFAMFYPDREILLFFVIPMRIRWVAILSAITLIFYAAGEPDLRWPFLFGNLNFLIAFGPAILHSTRQRAQVMERRARFQSAQQPSDTFFHQCAQCGRTEVDDPSLEFRVTDSGDEICDRCREGTTPVSPPAP